MSNRLAPLVPGEGALNPEPRALHPQPSALHLEPSALNSKPWFKGKKGEAKLDAFFFFFFIITLKPRVLGDTKVYGRSVRARLGTTAHSCKVDVLKPEFL